MWLKFVDLRRRKVTLGRVTVRVYSFQVREGPADGLLVQAMERVATEQMWAWTLSGGV